MRKTLTYAIHELTPYINWLYFYHAWGVSSAPEEERRTLRTDAEAMLAQCEGRYRAHTVFSLLPANSDGDDICINDARIPMLRQQHPSSPGKPTLCLSDFIRPLSSGKADTIGLFAASVDEAMEHSHDEDVYSRMMVQTLADRLAEAAAEKMHEEVRKHYWGYAPDEHLSPSDLHCERYQGIRPAIGYPSLPDTSIIFILYDLLGMQEIGISLTESGMMVPHASVSGFMFAHPQARYFNLGKIGEDQLADYARRRHLPPSRVRQFLETSLSKR